MVNKMEINNSTPISVFGRDSIDFYKQILDHVPAIVYINTFTEQRNPFSLINIWSNRFTQEFVGYSQKEIHELGFSFFEKVIHPEDLAITTLSKVLDVSVEQPPEIVYTLLQRLKPKGKHEYVWLYGHGIQIESFGDGCPKTLLSSLSEITTQMHAENQLVVALKEINRLNNKMRCQSLTKREKEVLVCIASGLTDLQISRKLFISFATAKTHRNRIIKKLKVRNTACLVAFAMECGLC
jgi:DNA-binding CsgD family transcriptional regulator